jgi:hypothetical protein
MSLDEKAMMRENAKNTITTLRDGMSPNEKAKMREKAKNTMNTLRDGMSPDEKAKMREKETIGRKRLRDGISPDERFKMRRKKTNDFECMKMECFFLHMTQDPENSHTRYDARVLGTKTYIFNPSLRLVLYQFLHTASLCHHKTIHYIRNPDSAHRNHNYYSTVISYQSVTIKVIG